MPTARQRQDLILLLKRLALQAGFPDRAFPDSTLEALVGQESTEAELFTKDATSVVLMSFPMPDNGKARFIQLDVLVSQGDTGEIFMQRQLKIRRTSTGVVSSVFRTVLEDWSDGIAKDACVMSLVDNAGSVDLTVTGIAATTLRWKARATVLQSN